MRIWTAVNATIMVLAMLGIMGAAATDDRKNGLNCVRILILVLFSLIVEGIVVLWQWAIRY